jgi:Asp-tRNA(Asn)/Glu-tRNA(Gln) amidotransferase A subunit family amidase
MREPASGSARDRLEKVLARLAERETEERVFLKLYPDPARVFADAADARSRAGISRGPLDGRIVSIKDIFDVAGETTPPARPRCSLATAMSPAAEHSRGGRGALSPRFIAQVLSR